MESKKACKKRRKKRNVRRSKCKKVKMCRRQLDQKEKRDNERKRS
jgi:hypothetical protein